MLLTNRNIVKHQRGHRPTTNNMLGYKRIVVISMDYAFGHETVAGFQRTFEENGGQIVQKLWIPMNVQDYAPYLAQIKRDADAVFTLALGRYSVLFAKQYTTSGIKERLA